MNLPRGKAYETHREPSLPATWCQPRDTNPSTFAYETKWQPLRTGTRGVFSPSHTYIITKFSVFVKSLISISSTKDRSISGSLLRCQCFSFYAQRAYFAILVRVWRLYTNLHDEGKLYYPSAQQRILYHSYRSIETCVSDPLNFFVYGDRLFWGKSFVR